MENEGSSSGDTAVEPAVSYVALTPSGVGPAVSFVALALDGVGPAVSYVALEPGGVGPAVSFGAPEPGGVGPSVSCSALCQHPHHVAHVPGDGFLGCAVQRLTLLLRLSMVFLAVSRSSTPVLSSESCHDELRGGCMLNEFFELVQHDEGCSSGN